MIKYPILVLLTVFITSCTHREKQINVAGFYQKQFDNLTLNENGTFEQEHKFVTCLSFTSVTCIKGTYAANNNIVKLIPQFWSKEDFEGSYRDLTLVERTIGPLNNLPNLFFDSIAVIPWNKKMYLLIMNNVDTNKIFYEPFPGEIDDFIDYANNNDTTFERPPFWSKQCKDCYEQKLRNVLPEQWKQNVLNGPLKAKITAVDSLIVKDYRFNLYTTAITIDAGAKKGVRRGMKFYSKDGCPHHLEIVEVHDDFSKGLSDICKMKDCKLNAPMTTYIERHHIPLQ